MFFDRGYPFFRNFNSTLPDDVIRVKSCADIFLDPTCVPVTISINKLDLVANRIEAGLAGVCSYYLVSREKMHLVCLRQVETEDCFRWSLRETTRGVNSSNRTTCLKPTRSCYTNHSLDGKTPRETMLPEPTEATSFWSKT